MYTPTSVSFGNGTESARRAKYKGNDNTLEQTAHKLVMNGKVVAEKTRLLAENEEKMEVSREYLNKKMLNIVENGAKDSDKIRAGHLIADMGGLKRETAPNTEREAARKAKMDVQKRRIAEKVAKEITDEESGEPETIKIRA